MSIQAAALGTLLALLAPVAVAARQLPPEPPAPRAFTSPSVASVTLASGAAGLVVQNREVPIVTVDLILPGGQASDPEGLEGLSLLTAALLQSGTTLLGAEAIATELDRLGATLTATADADHTRISLVAMSDLLEPALGIMGQVVAAPRFPEGRVEVVRDRAVAALEGQRGRAGAVARQTLLREVYRDHPYGRQPTEATVSAIDRAALVEHHRRWYLPGSALFAVAGDIDAQRATRLLNTAFAGWRGGSAPQSDQLSPVTHEGGITLVHRPGAAEAEVRIGHALPRGNAPAWRALDVAAHHLGAAPSGRLWSELRDARGLTSGAAAIAEPRLGSGVLEVAFATPAPAVSEALGEALRILEDAARRPMSEEDFRASVEHLSGAFTLQNETPRQVVGRLASWSLLGLDGASFEGTLESLRALTAGEVRQAFASAIDPRRLRIVVVGDATVLQPQLAIYGDVRIESPEGRPLSMADLAPSARSTALSTDGLPWGSYRYDVVLQGQPVGSLTREYAATEDLLAVFSELDLGAATTSQSVHFTAEDFAFVSSTTEIVQGVDTAASRVYMEDGRLRGSLSVPGGALPIDMAVPPGVLVSDMLEVAVSLADLQVGTELRLPVANVAAGTIANAILRVEERTSITVPAGTFDVFRVEIEGAERQTIWARVEAPHVVVRVAPGDQPILVELVAIEPPAAPGG